MKRIHFLQNITFETPAYLEQSAIKMGFQTAITDLSKDKGLPDTKDFEALVIMGGPMNVYETDNYPWLEAEKELIRKAIREKKKVLGICLGAQLIADCMGAKVSRNREKEIGWFPVTLEESGVGNTPLLRGIPAEFTAFHWHGDTFSIPESAVRIGSSEACPNQGFIIADHVLALQFHLETTLQSMENLLSNCSDELVEAPYIQSAEEIRLKGSSNFEAIHQLVDTLMSNLLT